MHLLESHFTHHQQYDMAAVQIRIKNSISWNVCRTVSAGMCVGQYHLECV